MLLGSVRDGDEPVQRVLDPLRKLLLHAREAALVDAGTLPVTIDREFPFEQIAEAMAYLEAGRAKGKVVVRMA